MGKSNISNLRKPKAVQNAYKYSRRSGCWNCNLQGHTFKNCRFPKTLRCSICRKPNVKTINCSCRKNVLQGLITKSLCEPLRIVNDKLVIDVNIGIDNFIAEVNPSRPVTTIHKNLANYIRLMSGTIFENTIHVEMKIAGRKRKLSCMICDDCPFAIQLGLPDLLIIGFRFGHESILINKKHKPKEIKDNLIIEIQNDNYQESTDIDEDVLSINWDESGLEFE